MRIVCSWCRRFLGEKAGAPGVSHGICAECEANLFERTTEPVVYHETEGELMTRSWCPGGGNWVKSKRRKTLTGPQVQCHECGRWLRQPQNRPRSVPAHKPHRYVAPIDRPVSRT